MSATTCYVQSADWVRYWQGKLDAFPSTVTPYTGPDRRIATSDRRQGLHDRRWQAVSGRRYRAGDRRRG